MATESVRPPAFAGLFYEASATALRRDVEACLAPAASETSQASEASEVGRPLKALIAPHAGYVYSGPVAGSVYRLLAAQRATIRRIVLLGPAHRVAIAGLALPGDDYLATPLGTVRVDKAAVAEISSLPQVTVSREAHAGEHSLEVELPFLQVALDDFSVVPLVVGRAGAEAVAEVLERLWGGEETLLVVSSDLSHYLSYDEARRRDRHTADRILALDATLSPHDACGCEPINGLLTAAARRGLTADLVDLRNSGDTAGDRDRVVGYAAVAFCQGR